MDSTRGIPWDPRVFMSVHVMNLLQALVSPVGPLETVRSHGGQWGPIVTDGYLWGTQEDYVK